MLVEYTSAIVLTIACLTAGWLVACTPTPSQTPNPTSNRATHSQLTPGPSRVLPASPSKVDRGARSVRRRFLPILDFSRISDEPASKTGVAEATLRASSGGGSGNATHIASSGRGTAEATGPSLGGSGRATDGKVDLGTLFDKSKGRPASDGLDARRSLLTEAIGYGAGTTGGFQGPLVRVTSLEDDGPGSLREAVGLPGPAWIIFDIDGVIHLRERLWMTSDKTIDGRGSSIEIRDHGFALREVENVIITNLRLVRGNRDGVDVHGRSRNIWLHHLTVVGYEDGAIDITRGATDVTVSWCRIADQVKVMLVGAHQDHVGDKDIRVTLHHTLFEGTGQRHPRVRWGRVHAFNNVVDHWDSFGMAASQHGELRSENNVFIAGPDSEEAIKSSAGDPDPGRVASIGDLVIGEARIEVREAEAVFDPAVDYDYASALDYADNALIATLRAGAGWQALPREFD